MSFRGPPKAGARNPHPRSDLIVTIVLSGFRVREPRSRAGMTGRESMREIVFDTETTGLDPYQGDRLVEVGCVELINGFPTGNSFHTYLNPERDMPEAAFNVHGLSIEFLKDKPLFADVCEEFLAFVADAPLIAHNAMF